MDNNSILLKGSYDNELNVDSFIEMLREIILWGEKEEPDIFPKECYNAFYEFVAFCVGTKQPFFDYLADLLNYKRYDFLSYCLVNDTPSVGQLVAAQAFELINLDPKPRCLLDTISDELTSSEYEELVSLFNGNPLLYHEERKARFQKLFKDTNHKQLFKSLYYYESIILNIIKSCEESQWYCWRHQPLFDVGQQKTYLEFLIVYYILSFDYQDSNFILGNNDTSWVKEKTSQGLLFNDLINYHGFFGYNLAQKQVHKNYYEEWIKKLSKKKNLILAEKNRLIKTQHNYNVNSLHISRMIIISGFINHSILNKKNDFNISLLEHWIARCNKQLTNIGKDGELEQLDAYKSNQDANIIEYIQTQLKKLINEEVKNIPYYTHMLGDYVLLYSFQMIDLYNQVKGVLDKEQKELLLQILKQCRYTNCLLPYYVDDYEPETTEEKHQKNDFSVSPESSYVDIFNFFDNDSIYSKKTVKKGNYTLTAKQLFTNYTEMFIKESKKIGNQLDVYAFMYMWVMSELFNVNMIIHLVLPEVLRRLLHYSSYDNNDGWRNIVKEYTIRAEGVRKKLEKKGENAQLAWKDICGIVPIMYDVIFGGSFFSMRKHRGRKSIDEDVQPPYESIAIRRIYTVFYFEKEYKERYEGTIDDHNVSFPQFLRDYYAPGYFLSPAEYYYKAYREKDDSDESKKSLAVQLYNMIKQEKLYNREEQEHMNI